MHHQLSQTEQSLKAATFRAVRKVGGVEAAAQFVRVGKSALATYYNQNHTDCFAPLDVAATLDEQAGYPFIAEALKMAFNPVLGDVGNPHKLLGKMISESGELGALFSDALSDGRICPKEAAQIKKEAEDLKAAAQRIIDMASALEAGCA